MANPKFLWLWYVRGEPTISELRLDFELLEHRINACAEKESRCVRSTVDEWRHILNLSKNACSEEQVFREIRTIIEKTIPAIHQSLQVTKPSTALQKVLFLEHNMLGNVKTLLRFFFNEVYPEKRELHKLSVACWA